MAECRGRRLEQALPYTIGVVVTYKPDLPPLQVALQMLSAQVDGLVLVDNGSGGTIQTQLQTLLQDLVPSVSFQSLLLPDNAGLGLAQNVGIALARERLGAECVLLMDQDSQPGAEMVATLQAALQTCHAAGGRPGVIGANYTEPQRGLDAILPSGLGAVVETEEVIASGALVPLAVWDEVGAFDEDLFIDFVDTEWCFRARAAGYRCYIARGARMEHRIGAPGPFVAGRYMALHSPERMYYQLRNLLLLTRRPEVPRRWLLRMLPGYLARSVILMLVAAPRRARVRAVGLGLWHGFCGRSGAFGA